MLLVILSFTAKFAFADSVNLLTNGSFESPFAAGSLCGVYSDCLGFLNGVAGRDDIGGWQLIGKGGVDAGGLPIPGAPATILVLSNNYTEPLGTTDQPLYFHALDGLQSLDLTGEGNQGTTNGIKQVVATTPGLVYELSFWVGHQDGSAPGYLGGPGGVALYVDGGLVLSAAASGNTPGDVSWTRFTHRLTATDTQTIIAFLNDTPVGNNYAGLDAVSVVEVPEPSPILLLLTGLVAIGVLWRCRG